MAAQVGDAAQTAGMPVLRGEGGQRSDHGSELADGGQVRVDAPQAGGARSAHHEGSHALRPVAQLDVAAQARQQLAPGVAGLGRGRGPAGEAHLAAGDERRGQEGTGVGQVRLYARPPAGGTSRVDDPGAPAPGGVSARISRTGRTSRFFGAFRFLKFFRFLDDDAAFAQAGDGHGHVRQGRDVPDGGDGESAGQQGADQQQGGQELGGGGGVHAHPVGPFGVGRVHWAAEGAIAGAHAHGQAAGLAQAGHLGAQFRQSVQQRAEGAQARGPIAVEDDGRVRDRGQRRDEAHDSAGQADVYAPGPVGTGLHMRGQRDGAGAQAGRVPVDLLETGPERGQGRQHEIGVARAQNPGERRRSLGHRGQHEGAGRQRLRARQGDGRVEGAAGGRCGPGLASGQSGVRAHR